ncbi:MAG: transporter related protein [Acidimicrobiaceae bacterium]|nr:transporter related protein [Acidimicrobiaceae bacterium]
MLGPNGAGKTTLLSLVGAQRQPSSGRVEVLGRRIGRTDVRELRRNIAVVGHSVADRLPSAASALEIVLTGEDSLLAPWWGEFGETQRAAALRQLAELGCKELADQAFGACSQGERQRVLLARALFGRHRLLLLDEPAVGVDLPGREALVCALDAMARSSSGPTTIQVAHTLEELPSSTTHALLMRDGLVVAAGPAEEVLTDASLSACYGIEFRVERRDGRYAAWAVGAW